MPHHKKSAKKAEPKKAKKQLALKMQAVLPEYVLHFRNYVETVFAGLKARISKLEKPHAKEEEVEDKEMYLTQGDAFRSQQYWQQRSENLSHGKFVNSLPFDTRCKLPEATSDDEELEEEIQQLNDKTTQEIKQTLSTTPISEMQIRGPVHEHSF